MMPELRLYDRRSQAKAQEDLAKVLRRWADHLDLGAALEDEHGLAWCADEILEAFAPVMAATPAGVLETLRRRNWWRVAYGALMVLDWCAVLSALGGILAAAATRDGHRALAWFTLLAAAIVANRQMVRVESPEPIERTQLRVLACWNHNRPCTECSHGPHKPGACWATSCRCGATARDKSSL